MTTSRTIAWNTIVQFIGKIISTAIGVIVVGLMARHLGQIGFGLYSTANAYFQIFVLLLDLGLNVTLAQMLGEYREYPDLEKRLSSATFTLRLISSFILLTIAAVVGMFLPYPLELRLAFIAIWGSFFATALNQIVISVHQRYLRMHIVVIGEVAGRLILLIGVIAARYFGWGLVPIVAFVTLGSILNLCINILVARYSASFRWNIDVEMWKRILMRSWPIGISIFFNLIYYKADTLILSQFRPFAEVGIYGAAYRVLDILTTMPFMYMGIVLPILAHAWSSKENARFAQLLRDSYLVMALCAAPIIAGTIALSKQIMTLVAGPDFSAAGPILNILVIAAGVIFLGTVSSHAVVALHQQKSMLKIYIITAIITLIGYVLFIPQYGMWAAAGLTLFSESLVAIGSTISTIRTSQTSIRLWPFVKVFSSAGIMYLAVLPLRTLPIFIPIFVGALVYTVLVLLSGVISNATIKNILTFKKQSSTTEGF